MWPGPGLVVMALAFISVARRGISQTIPNQGNTLGKVGDEDTGSLARVNPWLSACDLAPGPNSAPDLQGQCSAGTLPVALVNEGPGPPECPPSCETLRLIDRNTANNNNNKMEENRFNEKQQCLDYFGDNEESSPAQICKKSSRDITTKLRSLRLRHCCERSAFSAIHSDALVAINKGGYDCIRTLNDLLDADALASRITCELNEILVRYDCRQLYSIKHGCRDCKEAYRRWVCSTLIPYFAEPDDIRQNLTSVNKNGNASSTKASPSPSSSSSSRSSRNVNGVKENVLTGLVDHEEDPVLSRLLKRSRRKTETIRKKIRPCLSVCQTVEENCPYMLPGDRVWHSISRVQRILAVQSSEATLPTSETLDPNIPETGDQLAKSNHGPDNCCYRYCGSVKDGLCTFCDLPTNQTASKRDESTVEPETCQNLPGPTSTSSQRCVTPFQAAAAAMLSLSSSSSSSSSNRLLASSSSNNQFFYYYYTWTISWSLISVVALNRFCLQLAGS